MAGFIEARIMLQMNIIQNTTAKDLLDEFSSYSGIPIVSNA